MGADTYRPLYGLRCGDGNHRKPLERSLEERIGGGGGRGEYALRSCPSLSPLRRRIDGSGGRGEHTAQFRPSLPPPRGRTGGGWRGYPDQSGPPPSELPPLPPRERPDIYRPNYEPRWVRPVMAETGVPRERSPTDGGVGGDDKLIKMPRSQPLTPGPYRRGIPDSARHRSQARWSR